MPLKSGHASSSSHAEWYLILILLLVAVTATQAKIPATWLSNAASFAGGGVGGVCSVLVGHPFDLVKVKQQTAVTTKGKAPVKKGTFGTIAEICNKEGLKGLYRGVSAPILAVAPIFAVSFWGFDTGDKLVRMAFGLNPTSPLTMVQLCLAGGFSAIPTAVIMVPSERIKCLLQIQQSSKDKQETYSGFRDCASRIYKEDGMKGLYKGTTLTLMRDIPGNMIYFGVYDIAKRMMGNSKPAAFAAGALAGIAFWPAVLPLDCLKSRFQTAPPGTYKNIGEVYSTLVEEEGIGGMFRGIGPAMIRSAPANAVSFLGAEITKSALAKFM